MLTIIIAILLALLIWKVILPLIGTTAVIAVAAHQLKQTETPRFYCGGCVRPLERDQYPQAGGRICNDCELVGNVDLSLDHPEAFQIAIDAQEQS